MDSETDMQTHTHTERQTGIIKQSCKQIILVAHPISHYETDNTLLCYVFQLVRVKSDSSAVECRTRNQVDPVSRFEYVSGLSVY